jgi:hypothetical protein
VKGERKFQGENQKKILRKNMRKKREKRLMRASRENTDKEKENETIENH